MNLGYFPRKNIWHLMILSSKNLSKGFEVFSVARIGVPREVPVVGSRPPKSPSISLARTTKRLGLRGLLLLLLLLPPPIPDNLRLLCCRNPWLTFKEKEEEEEEQQELANAEREESEESTTVTMAGENAKAIIPHTAAEEIGSLGREK
jgi:hypothetical protein